MCESSAAPKKKHLIEAALFGHLDQMLSTVVQALFGGRSGIVRRVVLQIISGAEKKSFDRGGPVWPPRSNVKDDRFGGDTSDYDVESPLTSGPARGKVPRPQKTDMNLTDLT